METNIKKWRDNNKDKVRLQKKREKVKNILRKYNVLPKVGDSPNEEQSIILEQISKNDFTYYNNFKIEKSKQSIAYKKRIHKEEERPVLKRARITYELRIAGILPEFGVELNEEQKNIIDFVNENYETPIKSFISSFSHLITPEYRMWYKTKVGVQKSGKRKHGDVHFDLEVSDIVIPEYCPYLGIKLKTDIKEYDSPFYYSIDRIDSTNGYIKGNIQIISRLANTMKNNATIDQLLVFSENVIRLHKPQFS
jgi:hypothetical protein